ncbi:hypothetical protein CCACVL1_08678 [Corchorus capsularis]|uniref:Uncharacterized protein n=1 Tax=Corchorus capsularis TaxID=210143 RepID=A0A1R3IZB0_COCAP|nr:hypothetical protein CCACVL1_08678 [Corchorus capsularis]
MGHKSVGSYQYPSGSREILPPPILPLKAKPSS